MKPHTFPPSKILIPIDFGGASAAALAFGRLFREQFGSHIHVLHAQYFETPPYFSSSQLDLLQRELERSRRQAVDYLRRETESVLGPGGEVIVLEKPAVEAILTTAQTQDIDLILMGTRGRHGAGRLLLGSVAERVLRGSRSPVMAVHESRQPSPLRHLLCPVNFSKASRGALEYAAQIAIASGGRLSVLHAVEPGAPPIECPLIGEDTRSTCEIEETVLRGDGAITILNAVETIKPDMIVMGADHEASLLGELFSSTTQKVMQSTPVPILVVPRL